MKDLGHYSCVTKFIGQYSMCQTLKKDIYQYSMYYKGFSHTIIHLPIDYQPLFMCQKFHTGHLPIYVL